MSKLKVEPSDDKDGKEDHLMALLGIVSEALAKRNSERQLTAEQCEEISRRST